MRNFEGERPTPEEVRFDTLHSGIRRAIMGQGGRNAVILASDFDSEMHLELMVNGHWNIKTGGDRDEYYGKVDLPTATQLIAFVTSSPFRIIETATPHGAPYKEAMDAHMAENGLAYQQRLFDAMEAALGEGM